MIVYQSANQMKRGERFSLSENPGNMQVLCNNEVQVGEASSDLQELPEGQELTFFSTASAVVKKKEKRKTNIVKSFGFLKNHIQQNKKPRGV